MPAEWEPHSGTWLAWPHRASDWPGKLAAIPWVYAEIVRTISRHETVKLLVRDDSHRDSARKILASGNVDLSRVQMHVCPTDRSWVRDSGPIFVTNASGERGILDWHFNAWAKYGDWFYDDVVPEYVQSRIGCRSWKPRHLDRRVVLEGGSIDVDGRGLMLTTEECLLSDVQQRNPGFAKRDYEQVFVEYLGGKKDLWFDKGIVGDDTHGHVDDLARFVNPRTVVLVSETREEDENYIPLRENFERLQGATDVEGKKLEIVKLPMPHPVVCKGVRLPASYANFYIANGTVLVPTFNDPSDRKALGILADLFPDREVVGTHCVDLVWGLGTLHCMTQQEPVGK